MLKRLKICSILILMQDYEFYHQHSVNQAIHFVCIPMLIITFMNYFSKVYICLDKYKDHYMIEITLKSLLELYYIFYYFSLSMSTGIIMMFYMSILGEISKYWLKNDKRCITNTTKLFLLSWTLQFAGHLIEGKRPALVDGFTSSFIQAPLFSLSYAMPFLKLK